MSGLSATLPSIPPTFSACQSFSVRPVARITRARWARVVSPGRILAAAAGSSRASASCASPAVKPADAHGRVDRRHRGDPLDLGSGVEAGAAGQIGSWPACAWAAAIAGAGVGGPVRRGARYRRRRA